jgi:hypothetical protein
LFELSSQPHAFPSGHAHNYQRFTRIRSADGDQIPYLICGNGGHGLAKLAKHCDPALRAPQVIQAKSSTTDQVALESYDDNYCGYLRIIVTQAQLGSNTTPRRTRRRRSRPAITSPSS